MGAKIRPVTPGQRFGRGTVSTPDAGRNQLGAVLVQLLCDCGARYLTRRNSLWRGVVKSCGCLLRQNLAGGVARGESCHTAVLTEADVHEIRRLYQSTAHLSARDPGCWTCRRLAAKFGASPQAIRRVVRRATWRHVI
jgi:hypothetical protein